MQLFVDRWLTPDKLKPRILLVVSQKAHEIQSIDVKAEDLPVNVANALQQPKMGPETTIARLLIIVLHVIWPCTLSVSIHFTKGSLKHSVQNDLFVISFLRWAPCQITPSNYEGKNFKNILPLKRCFDMSKVN